MYDKLITPGTLHHVFEPRLQKADARVSKSSNQEMNLSFFFCRSTMPADPKHRHAIWRFNEYVGNIVAKEIAERWYHTGVFVIDHGDRLLRKLLSHDVWECGNVPAAAIRHIRISVGEGDFSEYIYNRWGSGLNEEIEELLAISHKNAEIGFNVGHHICAWTLSKLIWRMRYIITRLRSEGFTNVKILRIGEGEVVDIAHIFDIFDPIPYEAARKVSSIL